MAAERISAHSQILSVNLCKLSVAMACISTIALRNWSYIVYASQALMILMVLHRYMHCKSKHGIALYAVCYGLFSLWCLVSTFWADSPTRALSATVGVVQFTILGCCLALFVEKERDVDFVIDCLAWSGIVLLVVLLAKTPASVWREAAQVATNVSTDQNRIGNSVGYHPNALGHICAVYIAIWYYKLGRRKHVLYWVPIIAFLVVVLFTKSRLSIVIAVACIVLYRFVMSKGGLKKAGMLIVLSLMVVVVFWALLNVPALYQLIGFRFAAMLGMTGVVDASTSTRAEMIHIAFKLFAERPFTGVGFANYAVHYYFDYGGWTTTYAHSNYAELLADLGVFGTAAYYAVPVWTLYQLLRMRSVATNRNLHALLTATIACLLISDWSSISYTNDFTQLLWATSYVYVLVVRQKVAEKCDVPNRLEHRSAGRNANTPASALAPTRYDAPD